MKKSISLILAIFICFNLISTTYSLAYTPKNTEVKQTSAVSKKLINLAVFIEFSDSDKNVTNHLDDEECVQNAEKIFNSETLFDMNVNINSKNEIVQVPSFKKYYEMQSYGKLSIETKIFPKIYGKDEKGEKYEKVVSCKLPNPIGYYLEYSQTNTIGYNNKEEYLQRETELVEFGIKSIKEQVEKAGIQPNEIDANNDEKVDAISFFVEGQKNLPNSIKWGDLLWSHMLKNGKVTEKILGKTVETYNLIYVDDYKDSATVFSLNNGTYGTMIHEFGHTLGYKDLYRYDDYSSKPVGFYDIMGNSSYSNPGNFLTYFISEYNRETNWHSPLPVINKTTKNITLYKPEFQDENEMRAIKIEQSAGSKEYFVIEYHEKKNTYQSSSADASGIIVYRVNDNNRNNGCTSRRK